MTRRRPQIVTPFLCYTAGMPAPLRLVVLCSALLAATLGACKEDEAPLACLGDVEAHTLAPLEPCLPYSDQCVEGSFCAEGYCTLPCLESEDCLGYEELGGADSGPKCYDDDSVYKAPDPARGCHYFCYGEQDCPAWLGDRVVCNGARCFVPDEVCGD